MDAATRFDTRVVGALPVVTQYMERLGLAEAVDGAVPWEGEVPLGTLVEVLIVNRLLEPKALFRVDEWARGAAVADYYGLGEGELNDDRLGRALGRLAAHADAVQAALVVRAVRAFGLDVSQVHYDITGVELFGAYDLDLPQGATPPTPLPAYGRTKSGRKDVKQVQLGLNVTGDGGVPVLHGPLDGNAAEVTTHLDNLRRLRQVLPKRRLLYVADTKLDAPGNLLAVASGKGLFLCGGVFSPQLQEMYLAHRGERRVVDYHPKSQHKLPPAERDRYEAFELWQELDGRIAGRAARLRYRLVFVWSQSKARQEAQTRERHLAKVREGFEAVARNLNRYSLKTREAAVRRLEAARGRYAEGKLLEYELTEDGAGQLRLRWGTDEKALEQWKLLEGVYALKTNLPSGGYPLAKVLAKYKEQSKVERRIHHLKGPLAVAPVFLKNPDRIAGLLCVLVWALMVLALMERQVRRKLKGKPLYGLYPENRPSPAPTGPALLACFASLCIVIVKERGTTARRLAQPTDTQRKLLLLLGIPPDALRTFKRRCGM
jgi:transposase